MTAPIPTTYSILGVAGAGKTTQLIDLLNYLNFENSRNEKIWERHFEPVELNRIAFISFSNTAIQEIANRTGIEIKARKKSAPGRYFRTVTGLAEVLLYENNLMTFEEVRSVSKLEGFRIKWAREHGMYYKPRDNDISYSGNEFFAEYSRLVNTYYHVKSLSEIIEMHSKSHLLLDYIREKEKLGIVDYEDILMRAYDYRNDIVVDLEYMIIDEAQDNSLLDYATLLPIAKNNATELVLAGDDAQLIYDFRGANYKLFHKLIERSEIILNLTETRRFGSEIANLATAIIDDMNYIQKREVLSAATHSTKVAHIDLFQMMSILQNMATTDLTVYILARTNAVLNYVAKVLDEYKIQYKKNERITDFDRFLLSLNRLMRNEYTNDDIYTIYNYLRNKVAREEELKERLFQHKLHWTEKDVLGILLLAYEQTTAKRILTTAKNTNFKIKLSTIHSAKGSEADVVFLINSVPHKTKMKILENYEGEKRVLYVAVTRARKFLFIVDQPVARRYEQLYYIRSYESRAQGSLVNRVAVPVA
ncbi:UvrD/REP helicase [Thermococcus onnurineus NA1]|uniref:UvrD/REP helicase n=1 Tax=Thermococcus onnurineus (strain NA1) TaxID=523850 RepID=B6YXQ7_THEON|nr:UvrD-helicase domain-containing protein [Thermococcus onnurineus]ACJ16870.1 UvrD/REP helicase [Thermococcus onnurineus NA1]